MTREEFMDIVYSELYSDGDNYRANRIIDAADEYALEQTRWISVSEGLPEELKGVLVYCPTNDNIFCAYLENGVWKIFSPTALEGIKEIVTAWMPLPQPYVPDTNDGKMGESEE